MQTLEAVARSIRTNIPTELDLEVLDGPPGPGPRPRLVQWPPNLTRRLDAAAAVGMSLDSFERHVQPHGRRWTDARPTTTADEHSRKI